MNVQLEPSRALPSIEVTYSWHDASARVIEQEVTSKLEGLFSSVKGIKDVNSVSYRGRGKINLTFKKNLNLDAVRFEIATIIRRTYPNLPKQLSYPEITLGTRGQNVRPILSYNLNASASPYYIQKYAENNISPLLSPIPGLNEVKIYGANPYEWEVKFNVDQIHILNIKPQEIVSAINTHFQKELIGMGSVKTPGHDFTEKISIVLQTYIAENESWNKIPVKKSGGRIIYLSDIATIRYKEQPPHAYYRINGLNTINLVLYPEEGINNIKLARDVKEKMADISQNLPGGYSVLLSYDSTEFIEKEIKKIALRTLFSMLILLLFVLLISRQFRYLLLISVSLVANLVIACIFYYLFKIEIHLYSLAGITVSFGIIIDNSIVMIDHIRHHRNKKVFLAILAATLTTIGALSMLFFLEESQRINLIDFAEVIIVNLSVSLLIALFFIPALMDKISLVAGRKIAFLKRKRRVVRISGFYERSILFSKRFKWAYYLIFILGFGIPVHWLPETIENENYLSQLYNKSIGSNWYQQNARSLTEKIFGGTLRLFSEHVFESSFYSSPQKTTLFVRGTMPEGSTIHQLNEAVKKMENHISSYNEVDLFQTSITSYRNSSISINFKPEFEKGYFPYFLKGELTSKAINLGGLDWSIYGVGRGFSNAINTGYKNSHIIFDGYNYDQLIAYAGVLKKKLLENPRIHEVDITGPGNWWRIASLHEFFIGFDRKQFGLQEITLIDFYNSLRDRVYRANLKPVYVKGELNPVTLVSDRAETFNVWDLKNRPASIQNKLYKQGYLAEINKQKTGSDIYKYNQQYRIDVAYDFIGPGKLSAIVMEKHIDEMNALLPLGYKASKRGWGSWWDSKDKKQYYLLLLIILIIYFICSILLESLLQPLAIVGMIPISFIGVFLTFYLFDFNFDQGGFASFILLSGIVVNAGLYIINDYNHFCRERNTRKNLKLYLKAYNHKIVPVFLTVISTIIGLIPFVWAGQNEVFWFAFAVGAMGGLLFSFIAVVVYLPLFLRLEADKID